MPTPLTPLRQAIAELLACAVCDLFPKTLLVASKISAVGFHYDFVFAHPIDTQALQLIEERMRFLVKQDLPIQSVDMMRANAIDFFSHRQQHLVADALATSSAQFVSLFKMGDFFDLSSLDAYATSSEIEGAFRLQNFHESTLILSEKDTLPLTRIEGTAFPDAYTLKKFLKRAEAAKKKDHLVLGEQMKLYSTHQDLGGGTHFWHPKGSLLRKFLLDLWQSEIEKQNTQFLVTPPFIPTDFLKEKQYRRSDKNRTSYLPAMTVGETTCALRSSLTPHHATVFQSQKPTQQELPLRYAECSLLFEQEEQDSLCGLFQSRIYEADREHLFCTPEQFFEELISSLHFIDKIIKMFGFEHHWILVHRNQGRVPYFERWKECVKEMERALTSCSIDYQKDESATQPYGPSLHVCISDALGREWKGPYITVDLFHAERLKLSYRGVDGQQHEPILMVRSIYGSIERFIALLVEHYGGEFPFWLSPEQIRVIPLSMKNTSYAEEIQQKIKELGFRSQIDYRLDNLAEKVHIAEREKVPYIIIVGENEERDRTITTRSGHKGTVQNKVKLDTFLEGLSSNQLDNWTAPK